jgi:hypothetical protein
MPALFAYLIAVGLLLGGGYGALSWLAAPEPVKVVAKAKQKPPSTHTASAPTPTKESSPPQVVDTPLKQASSDKPQSSEPEPRVVTHEQGVSNDGAEPSPDQRSVVHAETVPTEATQSPPQHEAIAEARQPKEEIKQEAKQGDKKSINAAPALNTASNTALTPLAKPKRPSHRQASRPPEKRALALMTLRTIEFPDGRRATMLIPYRDNRRAMAIDPEW